MMNLNSIKIDGPILKALVISRWKSGSRFLAHLLRSHPATFYIDQPLAYAKMQTFDEPDLETSLALEMITKLMKCNYDFVQAHWPNW